MLDKLKKPVPSKTRLITKYRNIGLLEKRIRIVDNYTSML